MAKPFTQHAAELFLRAIRGGVRWNARFGALLNELPLVLHTPELERASLDLHYREAAHYRDSANQASGLFPFEERMLARFFPAPPARVLLPAAGGGRELGALLARGFRVHAFEPTAVLAHAASRLAKARGGDAVACLTVQAWAQTPTGHFDAIFTGWGMWLHLLAQQDRLVVLRAFRQVCPGGPVLLSFLRRERLRDVQERVEPLEPLHPVPAPGAQRVLRVQVRQRLLGLPPLERNNHFQSGFFLHLPSELELREEAAQTGYGVAFYERDGSRYPHAVLLPQQGSGA